MKKEKEQDDPYKELGEENCTSALVWKGKAKYMQEVIAFLNKLDPENYIVFKKLSKGKLFIEQDKDEGGQDENPKAT